LSTRVLVIDDDVAVTDMLRMILEPKDFQVMAVNSSDEGVQAVQRLAPDVVLLDLHRPGVDGWKICRSIRALSPVPILVLSALNKPGTVAEALDEGADDYLIKPVPGGVLAAHLNNLARRARAERDAAARTDLL
jgi:DNA-binding response OmpR family regulator